MPPCYTIMCIMPLDKHMEPFHQKNSTMTKVVKAIKRKSTVVSSQTYRRMVEEALEMAPACALDLHGIYEALAEKYEQYRQDSVEVDWRVWKIISFVCTKHYSYLFLEFHQTLFVH